MTIDSGLHLPTLLRRDSLCRLKLTKEFNIAVEKLNMLHVALISLVGTGRPEFALDQLQMLLNKYPEFLPGHFVHAVAMLSSWSAPMSRTAKIIREYYMEEAIGIIMRLQSIQHSQQKTHKEMNDDISQDDTSRSTFILNAETIKYEGERSREADYLYQLEKLYFMNAFAIGGVNARTLALMACFVVVRSFSTFGRGMQNLGLRQGDSIGRARRLFDRAKDVSAQRESEGVSLKLEVFRNIFECTHESIIRHRKIFHDLHEVADDTSTPTKPVQADLEFFRCGEMLLVSGYLVPAKDKEAVKSKINNPNMIKWTSSRCPLTMRPLVLLPAEVLKVYEQGVYFMMKSLGRTEIEVRQKPKWKLLSEYVMQGIRIHSCGRSRSTMTRNNNNFNMQSVVRLSLPCIEYARLERNDIRDEQHCAKLLQRAFRGFQGRALWKRLHMRIVEQRRQKESFVENFEKMKNLRDWRHAKLALIQSNVKGWYLRRVMGRRQGAAVVIQCMARKCQAKQRVNQERKRRNGGPEVIEMIRRGTEVSGVKMMVVIYRCGMNYKIVGHDIMGGNQYQGFVYQSQVIKLLEQYNNQFSGSGWELQQAQIKPWQHPRVAEMLLGAISLTTNVTAITNDLAKGILGRKSEFIFVPKARATGRGIGGKPRERILTDEKECFIQFQKLQAVTALRAEREEKKKLRQIANKYF